MELNRGPLCPSRCVTDGATRWEHIDCGIFYQYKDRKYTLQTSGKLLH